MMNESWYEVIPAGSPLTQGDLIFDCPLLTWSDRALSPAAEANEAEHLKGEIRAFKADVIVMTQACDLEHGKVRNVVLCPHDPLPKFRKSWENVMAALGHHATEKAWRRTCDDLANGHVWNHCFLNSSGHAAPPLEIRVVDFHDIFTLPRDFLEAFLAQSSSPRLRLLPPYREHLSQAFARFFMRVGLPQSLSKTW